MTSRFAGLALATLLVAACGCGNHSRSASSPISVSSASSGGPQYDASSQPSATDRDAIRAAIDNHLHSNSSLKLDAMDMVVDSIAVRGNQAQAHAAFHIRNGGATGMTMEYSLQRSGNGWVVTNGQPADGNTQLPPSTGPQPAVDSTQSQPSMPNVDAFFKDHPAPKSN